MIDPHVHLRDWNQAYKETVYHGLMTAHKLGIQAVFEMPNTDPSIISRDTVIRRLELADSCKIPVFHGLFLGLTLNPCQIQEAVETYNEFFPRVVGFKMFAGGYPNLSISDIESQKFVISILSKLKYNGVIAVHCEKDSLIDKSIWNYKIPFSHTLSRPPISEVESVKDIIESAKDANFRGTVHICHVSVPESVLEIEKARKYVKFKITCALTPHHALFCDEMMKKENGLLFKVNPPLRPREMQKRMLELLFDSRIDFIESDHAPHTLEEKMNATLPNAHPSGFPGLTFLPIFVKILKNKGMKKVQIHRLTHENILKSFQIYAINASEK